VTWAIENKGYTQRRACGLVGMEPRVYRYRSSRPDDAGLRKRLRELAAERRRFGYRRLHLLLKREGVAVNWKKLYRLYREERLTVRKRGGRKRALGTRAPMAIPQDANQRWSLDFVSDTLTDGRRFRILWGQNKSSAKSYAKVERNMNYVGSRIRGLRSLWIGAVKHQFRFLRPSDSTTLPVDWSWGVGRWQNESFSRFMIDRRFSIYQPTRIA
jgi:transposase InsO family protein